MHSELIDALMNPARYPHVVDRVERVETHISWVLLAGEFAYKIKKPVDFGFLNFASLAARKHYCEEELRLNRRHAASIYLDVVAIGGTAQSPLIGGPGAALEYAVRMRRFDPQQGFDRLLARQALKAEHIDQLAAELSALHADADVAGPDSDFGSAEAVIAPMRDNFSTLQALLDDPARLAQMETLRAWTEASYQRLLPRLEQRKQDGWVRECHGDAHLGNVVLHEGRATLFDCLEFSPELRWTDTIADLAFTIMDLSDRGAEALGWRLLDAYLLHGGDHDGLDLLDFYLVYRAMVRAKVAALSLADAGSEEQVRRWRGELDDYLSLALRTAARPQPALILTAGVSGSGKSWLAERLLEHCGLVRLRSDVERKRLHGLPPAARTDSAPGQGLYAPELSVRTYRRLAEVSEHLLRAGLPVLIDAAFLKHEQRDSFRALAERLGLPFGMIVCTAPPEILEARVTARQRDGRDPSEAGAEVLHLQLAALSADPIPAAADTLQLDTSQDDAVPLAIRWLSGLRARR